ncbi:hypothetical protein DICVIV_07956 [Dictyocaulus viviparus]|uniref:Uncharacterized protein n=1 Tax=Dictyocaulus viviparus TaxID=29172 RepID=A0A0D8XMY0_DICVI|nr:hypothetical protein DICVIV_07956 [Dictyocaulus viviparus]
MDVVFKTRMCGTVAEKWWKDEMSWDDVVHSSVPRYDGDGVIDFVSQRVSLVMQLNSSEDVSNDSMDRRSSNGSLLSTGYGSTWSLSNSYL